uniref:tyrosine-protein phosphatase non-receptor type 22-like n=1 Tax=Myxine glutinosa TaxID=7769 RepID=UPI00358EB89E
MITYNPRIVAGAQGVHFKLRSLSRFHHYCLSLLRSEIYTGSQSEKPCHMGHAWCFVSTKNRKFELPHRDFPGVYGVTKAIGDCDVSAMDVRTLHEFVRRVEVIRASGDSEGFESEYKEVKKHSQRGDPQLCSFGCKIENTKKNRYKDILPYNSSRVILQQSNGDTANTYINASFIFGVNGPQTYIATQGPLPHTISDFWQMIWDYNVQMVIMACKEIELGKRKCEKYWAEMEETKTFGKFIITCEAVHEETPEYCVRKLNLTWEKEMHCVLQYHYNGWPDHGVPESPGPILDLIDSLPELSPDNPLCIHCSAGCGRTGAICAIHHTWSLLQRQCIMGDFSISGVIKEMRKQRIYMVQTKNQYEFVYTTIVYMFEKHLASLQAVADSSSTTSEHFSGHPTTNEDEDYDDVDPSYKKPAMVSRYEVVSYPPASKSTAQASSKLPPRSSLQFSETSSKNSIPIYATVNQRNKKRGDIQVCKSTNQKQENHNADVVVPAVINNQSPSLSASSSPGNLQSKFSQVNHSTSLSASSSPGNLQSKFSQVKHSTLHQHQPVSRNSVFNQQFDLPPSTGLQSSQSHGLRLGSSACITKMLHCAENKLSLSFLKDGRKVLQPTTSCPCLPDALHDYETVDVTDGSSGSRLETELGFKRRVGKPRGPREPPASWIM